MEAYGYPLNKYVPLLSEFQSHWLLLLLLHNLGPLHPLPHPLPCLPLLPHTQFLAEYGEAGKKIFKEDTDDDEDKVTVEDEGNGDSFEEQKYVNKMMQQETYSTTQGDKLKKKVQTDLKEILQVTDKERSQVANILHVLKESKCEKEKEQMGVMFLVQSALMEKKSAPGEWLYNKIADMKKHLSGTDYEMVPHMLNGIFHQTVTYYTPQCMLQMFPDTLAVDASLEKETLDKNPIDFLIKEEENKIKKNVDLVSMKKSKNGFLELGLVIKSVKLPNNSHTYPCPLDNCQKAFVSPHTCDAHLNRHLGYEYGLCSTCGYTYASRDSYNKHKCFAGIKTGGRRPASRGEKARKRLAEKKEKEQKEETVGKEMEETIQIEMECGTEVESGVSSVKRYKKNVEQMTASFKIRLCFSLN